MSSILDMFGLTGEQLEILYSIERNLTERDIQKNPKTALERRIWLRKWLRTLDDTMYRSRHMKVYDEQGLCLSFTPAKDYEKGQGVGI